VVVPVCVPRIVPKGVPHNKKMISAKIQKIIQIKEKGVLKN
jgi:hypothetical protein